MKKSEFPDSFEKQRKSKGYHAFNDQNDPVTMILTHKDVRKCAHNWKTFQSGATPGRIVIPSEEKIRDTRQIPFEVDPPDHKDYRNIVEPWFKRPNEESYKLKLTKIVSDAIDEVLAKGTVDVVSELALPIQSRALTLLLNIPYEESKLWISWGTHVFRSKTTILDADKAKVLYDYIDAKIEEAIAKPGDDLYSVLLKSEFNGRKMSKEEVKGVMVLTFAGGRDTIINAITNSISYFADHPDALKRLKDEPELINQAIEELIRYYSPLTQMGRVATEDTHVCEHFVKANSKISMNWASANRDESVFENANEVVIDRKANPHVGFGFGVHNCLGATHARQLLRIMINILAKKISAMEILGADENIEELGELKRKIGFNSLTVKFNR